MFNVITRVNVYALKCCVKHYHVIFVITFNKHTVIPVFVNYSTSLHGWSTSDAEVNIAAF